MLMSMKGISNVKTFHYIYKIIFLCGYPTGRYYLGKRTYNGTDMQKDPYTGSGNFCKAYFKKYGVVYGETYLKEIIEINPSKKINKEREKIVIGDLWKTDPLCMNLQPGGDGGGVPGHKVTENTRRKLIEYNSKPVLQYNDKGRLIKEWESATVAGRTLGIQSNDISRCCLKKINIYRGYVWRHKTNPLTADEIKYMNVPVIAKVNLGGEVVETYCSIEYAANVNKITMKNVLDCCNLIRTRVKDYTYRFWEDVKNVNYVNLPPVKGRKRPVNCYDFNGNFVKKYSDIKEAAREFAINEQTGYKNIMACCKGDYKHIYGYIWRFAEEEITCVTGIEPLWEKLKNPVVQLDLNGNVLRIYESVAAAVRDMKIKSVSAITNCCKGKTKTACGFKWKYVEENDKCLN